MRYALPLMLLLLACDDGAGGPALAWGDDGWWAEAPDVPSWAWILDETALPQPPPAVDDLGLDLDTDAAYVATAVTQGSRVWCYLSAGTAETYREDYADFEALDAAARAASEPPVLGAIYPEWPDERWLNLRHFEAFLPLMLARLDRCAAKGFVRVELDNMDAYDNETGFDLTADETAAYVEALVSASQARGLGVIHKGAVDLIPRLEPLADALLLEDCAREDFCGAAAPFVAAGKPAWNAEYPETYEGGFDLDVACARAEAAGVSSVMRRLNLDAAALPCALR